MPSQYGGSSPFIDPIQMQAGIGSDASQWHPDAKAQAAALRKPAAQTTSTPVNPLQQQAFGNTQSAFNTAQGYQRGLAGNQNELINKQLATARDDISTGMRNEGISAMSRGADPTLFRQRALGQGQQYLGHLQTGMTANALAAQGQAVNSVTGAAGTSAQAAGSAASNQTQLQLGTMAAQSDAQRVANEQAATQARLYQAPYDRLSGMMGQVAQTAPSYGALGGQAPLTGGWVGVGGQNTFGGGFNPARAF